MFSLRLCYLFTYIAESLHCSPSLRNTTTLSLQIAWYNSIVPVIVSMAGIFWTSGRFVQLYPPYNYREDSLRWLSINLQRIVSHGRETVDYRNSEDSYCKWCNNCLPYWNRHHILYNYVNKKYKTQASFLNSIMTIRPSCKPAIDHDKWFGFTWNRF